MDVWWVSELLRAFMMSTGGCCQSIALSYCNIRINFEFIVYSNKAVFCLGFLAEDFWVAGIRHAKMEPTGVGRHYVGSFWLNLWLRILL